MRRGAKLSTSIRPKISVRPDAIRKIIMPIARPATVSVTQVGTTDQRQRRPATSTGSSRSMRCGSAAIGGRSLMRRQAEPEQPLLQRVVRGERRHRAGDGRCGRRPSPHSVAELMRDCENSARPADGGAAALDFAESIRSAPSTTAGARPLVGSSTSSSGAARRWRGAIDSICFWPPDSDAGARQPESASAPGRARISIRGARRRCGPSRAARNRFSRTVSWENTAMVSGT